MVKQGCQCSAYKIIYWVGRNLKPHGNASSHCTALRRTNVLDEYNKDLLSFGQDSELFTSATTLFGPSFPEKAVEHLKQLHTLRQAGKAPEFSQGPLTVHTAREQANYYLQRRQARRDGYNSSQGKKAMSTHHPKEK